jgi:hypothetical protein
MDPSPKDWGLDGEVLGDSAGFGPGEVPVELGLRAASTKGDGAPLALGGGGFEHHLGSGAMWALAMSSRC